MTPNHAIAAFRDIYWTNDSDIQGQENPADVRVASNFDDFPPLLMGIEPTLAACVLSEATRISLFS